ncbi:MAG: 4Fe-4S binding protein [Candidatus Muiribacteriota bacterium]
MNTVFPLKYKKRIFFLFLVLSIVSTVNSFQKIPEQFESYDFTNIGKESFEGHNYLKVKNSHDDIFFILNSEGLPNNKSGYGGPLEIYLVLNEDLTIVDLALASHVETPAYVELIFEEKNFPSKFAGIKNIEEIQKIDSVTRATVTSEAVKSRVATLLDFFKNKKISPKKKSMKIEIISGFILVFISIISFIFYNKIPSYIPKIMSLLAGLFIFHHLQISIFQIYNYFLIFDSINAVFIFILLILICNLIFGRIYCGYMCPFGIIQEIFGFIGDKVIKKFIIINSTYTADKFFGKINLAFIYFLLIIAGFSFPVFYIFLPENEILNLYRLFDLNFNILSVAFIILAISLFVTRFYCRYICPTGFLFALIRTFSIFKTKLPQECSNCDLCIKNCPVYAIRKKGDDLIIKNRYCIDCRRCLNVCPSKNSNLK